MDDIWELVLEDPALGVFDRVCWNMAVGYTAAAAKLLTGFSEQRGESREEVFIEALRSPSTKYAQFVFEYLIEEHDDWWLKFWVQREGSSCHLPTLLILERRFNQKVWQLSSSPQLNLESVKHIWSGNEATRRYCRTQLFRFAIGESRLDILSWMFRSLHLNVTDIPDGYVEEIIRGGNDEMLKEAVAAGLGSHKLPFTVQHLRCCTSYSVSAETARTIAHSVVPMMEEFDELWDLIKHFVEYADDIKSKIVFDFLDEAGLIILKAITEWTQTMEYRKCRK